MLRGDKLILFYCDSYLVIDVNTGENKIISNKDFSLQNDFEIILGSENTDAIVHARHKESNFGNEQMINVMVYKRNKIQIGLIQFED